MPRPEKYRLNDIAVGGSKDLVWPTTTNEETIAAFQEANRMANAARRRSRSGMSFTAALRHDPARKAVVVTVTRVR